RTLCEGDKGLAGSGRVLTLLKKGAQVDALVAGEQGEVVLDRTPFYAEAGGQVGDAGELTAPGVRFLVEDTQKRGAAHSHLGRLAQGSIRVGDTLAAQVNGARRQATVLNHSATHLQRAGDIGLFKIVSEGGVAAGVRRIEALTGEAALDYVDQNEVLLRDLAALVRGTREELPDKVREQLERARQMEREIRALK